MSPWWRDRLVVRIAPDALRLTRLGRGIRRATLATESIAVAPTAGAAAWRAALDALAVLLRQDPRWRAAGLVIEVGAPFCRWMLLPPDPAIATDEEWDALARLELEAIHGDRARDWEVRLGEQSPGAAVPACAIDRGVVEAVRALCTGSGMKLEAVVPAFAAVFNAHRMAMRSPVSGLVHLDGDRVSIAILHRGRWVAVTGARFAGSPVGVLERDLIGIASQGLLPEGGRRLYVVDDTRDGHALPSRIGDWDVAVRTGQPGGQGGTRRRARPVAEAGTGA